MAINSVDVCWDNMLTVKVTEMSVLLRQCLANTSRAMTCNVLERPCFKAFESVSQSDGALRSTCKTFALASNANVDPPEKRAECVM